MLLNLFEELEDREIISIFSKGKTEHYKKGEFLFHEGDIPNSLDLLTEGRVQIFKYDGNSNEITMNFFSPHSLIAELAIITGIPYPASGRFITDAVVIRLPLSLLKSEIKNNISLNHLLVQSLFQKIQALNMTINRGLTMDSMQRVAHFLYHLPVDCPPLNHGQIASMLILRAETFSRILRQLKDLQIIDAERGQIKILNREGLKQFL
ncbi:Crp/Fnr family transcriptional regulator [Leptospira adleri]|uniref:Crp/Fnr family transcriptional regulator n=1 Tax=Leptospira adleri TaxID=2023186 RepID=UPI001082EB4D|nr:Crp/Fnr family transcriptional regulator [Leptospira adleri]TGM58888.1 Crp/Fnr family transcriptional regulator [Leptospira adleri]